MLRCNTLILRSWRVSCDALRMTSTTLKRLFVAVVAFTAVSAAFAIGYSTDFHAIERAPHAMEVARSWLASFLSGNSSPAWNIAAAIGIMAVIAKRSGKA